MCDEASLQTCLDWFFGNEDESILSEIESTLSTKSSVEQPGCDASPRYHSLKLGRWTEEEDEQLRQAVSSAPLTARGCVDWKHVSTCMPGRKEGQCKTRWYNHLMPGLEKGDMTLSEVKRICSLYKQMGPTWTQISSLLGNGRSPDAIRHKIYSLRRNKAWRKRVELSRMSGWKVGWAEKEDLPTQLSSNPLFRFLPNPSKKTPVQTQHLTRQPGVRFKIVKRTRVPTAPPVMTMRFPSYLATSA